MCICTTVDPLVVQFRFKAISGAVFGKDEEGKPVVASEIATERFFIHLSIHCSPRGLLQQVAPTWKAVSETIWRHLPTFSQSTPGTTSDANGQHSGYHPDAYNQVSLGLQHKAARRVADASGRMALEHFTS